MKEDLLHLYIIWAHSMVTKTQWFLFSCDFTQIKTNLWILYTILAKSIPLYSTHCTFKHFFAMLVEMCGRSNLLQSIKIIEGKQKPSLKSKKTVEDMLGFMNAACWAMYVVRNVSEMHQSVTWGNVMMWWILYGCFQDSCSQTVNGGHAAPLLLSQCV